MNITPERAIDLAEEIDSALKAGEFIGEGLAEAADCLAILRHYAEIAPKWQAVLDAEPVAARIFSGESHHFDDVFDLNAHEDPAALLTDLEEYAKRRGFCCDKLIIKPAP